MTFLSCHLISIFFSLCHLAFNNFYQFGKNCREWFKATECGTEMQTKTLCFVSFDKTMEQKELQWKIYTSLTVCQDEKMGGYFQRKGNSAVVIHIV